jgi:hypothetical protein
MTGVRFYAALAACVFSVGSAARAANLLVPGQYPTIQAAIDAAAPGDHVVVASGTYTGNGNVSLNLLGKEITLRSESGDPQTCILDGQDTSAILQAISMETQNTVVQGFTFRRGRALAQFGSGTDAMGGAIRLENASLTVRNCKFESNQAIGNPGLFGGGSGLGGAISAFGGFVSTNLYLENCSFIGNVARGLDDAFSPGSGQGGAIYSNGAGVTAQGCQFTSNEAISGTGGLSRGGGLCLDASGGYLKNCVFTTNAAGTGGGIYVNALLEGINIVLLANRAESGNGGGVASEAAFVTLINVSASGNHSNAAGGGASFDFGTFGEIYNSIVWGNSAPVNSGVDNQAGSSTLVGTSNVQGLAGLGANDLGGNLDTDPLFVQDPVLPTTLGDLHLQAGSPCVNAGDNTKNTLATDVDGNDRIDTGSNLIDMGAYELNNDPVAMIQALRSDVDALVTSGAILPIQGRILRFPLNRALAALANNDKPRAVNWMNFFIDQVRVMVFVRRMSQADGDQLIASAQAIISAINGP